jgi:hypothetical protein
VIDYCKAHPSTTHDEFSKGFADINAETLKVQILAIHSTTQQGTVMSTSVINKLPVTFIEICGSE